MREKSTNEKVSFQEIKDGVDLIRRNEKAKDEFVSGLKEVINYERKFLFMMIAGVLMLFLNIFGLLGFVLLVVSLTLFTNKLIHHTFWKNEGFTNLLYDTLK